MKEAEFHNRYKAIEKACLDYVEGFYEKSAERIETGVNESLSKRTLADGELSEMSRDDLIKAAVGGTRTKPEIRVVIYDVRGDIASACVTSDFTDYVHLAWIHGKWQVINVLWACEQKPEH